MLNELLRELKNWFEVSKIFDTITIEDGKIKNSKVIESLLPNQYFRIVGSVFNDGVYKNDETLTLNDETFKGAVWLLAIPNDVIVLSDDIDAWNAKYADAVATPYNSESFAGYSYSKASGSDGSNVSWQSTFNSRLNQWRKI